MLARKFWEVKEFRDFKFVSYTMNINVIVWGIARGLSMLARKFWLQWFLFCFKSIPFNWENSAAIYINHNAIMEIVLRLLAIILNSGLEKNVRQNNFVLFKFQYIVIPCNSDSSILFSTYISNKPITSITSWVTTYLFFKQKKCWKSEFCWKWTAVFSLAI